MAKTVVVEWKSFFNKESEPTNHFVKGVKGGAICAGVPLMIASTPVTSIEPANPFTTGQTVIAVSSIETSDAWLDIFHTVQDISDWLCVGTIIFAGAKWMFGDRTKALELLLGAAIGFLIIMHAYDIMEWLKHLGRNR